ncbi:DUF7342 family protein [Natrialbaceae archaeon AArc-T1-2]|uniref:DUF7342 family protein n=1 Tax=Natrialbaceae archaeon AArc-T1-2 TaxID=3053904 RepID=UPI00255B40CA|nr:ArsR family transcriptional regulator [Natrialbaceae archaeon AArc-T1-2]WIV68838.1 ArsR family transcriptional regulator [Natrialbaceae archaeon AArc-T1-2]
MDDSPRGVKAWTEQTTAFDRVRAIAQAIDQPRTAAYIATEAAVSETTAHDHLKRLVEMSVVRTVSGEDATLYEPDPLYARFRTLRRLIDEHSHAELLELKADVQQQIEAFEQQYDVTSPTELREQAADVATPAETMQLMEDASDWELSHYHLSVVNDAIDNYSEYTGLDSRVRV